MAEKEPFKVAIPAPVLADLRGRLKKTRWAEDFANDHWAYGTNGAELRTLVDYWLKDFNWRRQEREINRFAHYRTSIEGIPIHFIHEPGKGPRPIPLILSHGWPWTFWDLHKVIKPLSDPAAFGGSPEDAFDVVVPSLPGYGFSTPLTTPGINYWRTADLWVQLMQDVLGYHRFAAQGGDWGALITAQLGHKYADRMIGIHVTMVGGLSLTGGGGAQARRLRAGGSRMGRAHGQLLPSRKAATSTSRRPSRRPWRSRSTIRRRGCARGSWKNAAPGATATGTSSGGSPRTSC